LSFHFLAEGGHYCSGHCAKAREKSGRERREGEKERIEDFSNFNLLFKSLARKERERERVHKPSPWCQKVLPSTQEERGVIKKADTLAKSAYTFMHAW